MVQTKAEIVVVDRFVGLRPPHAAFVGTVCCSCCFPFTRAPISRVWAVVRPVDFRYLGKRIKDVSLEGKVSPSAVGGIRKVEYADRDKTVQTILLLELSDSAHTVRGSFARCLAVLEVAVVAGVVAADFEHA